MLAAFEFADPDRIPVVYHPSPAGLHVHGRKLLDLFNAYPPDNPIVFDEVPGPPSDAVDPQGRYHELRTDEWGTTWEYLIFGVHGHPKGYPFPDWQAALDYRFPDVLEIGSEAFLREKDTVDRERQEYLPFRGWISLFEKVCALYPFDEVLMSIAARDPHFLRFMDRLSEYWDRVLDSTIAGGADVITFGDDWGTQTAQMISTELFREIYKPRYRALMEKAKAADRLVFFHCCGYLGDLFDELLDLGIDGFWPQIMCYDPDTFPETCKAHRVAVYIHPDRQRLIPLGTPDEIDARIAAYADRYHALGGGGIFYVEIENDAPFENVEALVQATHRYR